MRKALLLLAALALSCDSKPRYDEKSIAAHKLLDGLGSDFLLGAATAPHQGEGGLTDDWSEWEKGSFPDGEPHIKNRDNASIADNSWEHWPEDVAALRYLGANAYRLGVDWSRVQRGPGAPLEASEVASYRAQLSALRAAGIRPVVTLYHFTLPLWAGDAQAKGWDSDATAAQLADFAGKAGAAFGDLVDDWVTINEPNVLVVFGWLKGVWPPGKNGDNPGMAKAFERVMRAHALSVAALRASDTISADPGFAPVRAGIALHARIFEPASGSPLDALVAGMTDSFFNAAAPDALATGHVRVSVPGSVELDTEIPLLAGSCDFLGINYYTRDFVRADLSNPALSIQFTPKGKPLTGLGWEIYPEGMERTLVRFSRYGWPLLITENGTADTDEARARHLRAHLYALDRARSQGVKVLGYLHWSLIDNFEWAEGYSAPFGLFSVDGIGKPGGTYQRIPKPLSVAVFREAAGNIGLSPR